MNASAVPEVYARDWVVEVRDTDMYNKWRPSGIFLATQQAGEEHGALFGCSHSDMVRNGLFYILVRQKMEITRYPIFEDRLKLETWVSKPQRTIIPRYFDIFEGEEKIGSVCSLWMICRASDRAILTPEQAGVTYVIAPERTHLAHPGKIKAMGAPAQVIERACLYSDVDYNGHMNNTRFVDWVCDSLGAGAFKDRALASLQINYMSEVRPGQNVILSLYCEGKDFTLTGDVNGEASFAASGSWV